MLLKYFLGIILTLSVLIPTKSVGDDKSLFGMNLDYYLENPDAPVSDGLKAWASQYHFVFVLGFTNEILYGYGKDNAEDLRKRLGAGYVTILSPSSLRSVEHTDEWLDRSFRKLYKKGRNRPLIPIGHSKGGMETTRTLLQRPSLITDGIVYKAVVLQSPLNGSHLVDKIFGGLAFETFTSFFSPLGTGGLHSLRVAVAPYLIAKVVDSAPKRVRQLVSSRLYYVRSHKHPREVATLLRPVSGLLYDLAGDNDGLVALEAQELHGFGNRLGDGYADHLEWLSSASYSSGTKESIEAFDRALLESLAFVDIEGNGVLLNCGRSLTPPSKD